MIKVGICDDSLAQVEIIKTSLLNYGKNKSDSLFEINCYNGAFCLLDELEKGAKFDILLLDICMPGMSGTEIAKSVRKNKNKTEIIFITTSDEFAVDAFALKATHYILKPFSQDEFNEAILRAVTKISAECKKSLTIKTKDGFKEIDLRDIIFIESFSHIQTIHLIEAACEVRDSLKAILEQLKKASEGQFISPCKGYIINLKHAKTLSKNGFVMTAGHIIPMAKRSFPKIKEMYFNFKFGDKI